MFYSDLPEKPLNPPEVYAYEPTPAELNERVEEVVRYWTDQQNQARYLEGLLDYLYGVNTGAIFEAYFAGDIHELGRLIACCIDEGVKERAYTYAEQEAKDQLDWNEEKVPQFR